ncbi:MAG: hypothetical protein JXB05_13920 [Myxococcaceae bacterium]|nr:hypothetical protein [Myxococcaceae bacterium]
MRQRAVRWVPGVLVVLTLAACPGKDDDEPKPVDPNPLAPGTLSGAVTVPNGGAVAGTKVTACFTVDSQCDLESPNTRSVVVQGEGASAEFLVEGLATGAYVLMASKDNNANGVVDTDDYDGIYGGRQSPLYLRPPMRGINFTLSVVLTASNFISGKVSAPAGGDVDGTQVTACFVSNGQCAPGHASTRQVVVRGTGASGMFSFEGLTPGQYLLSAFKDLNGNTQADTGDYEGVYSTGGLEAAVVAPPLENANVPLRLKGGRPQPPGVVFVRPADFVDGSATVTLQGLSIAERVVVIPVHASQYPSADGLDFTLSTTGVSAQGLLPPDAPSPREAELVQASAREEALARREAHLRHLEQGQQGVETLRRAGVQPLMAKGTAQAVQAAFRNCPGPYTVDVKVCDFWVGVDSQQERITATVKSVSEHAYWFVQNEDVAELGPGELQGLMADFESKVMPTDLRYFGEVADLDANEKIIIVFSRRVGQDNLYGYVHPVDFFSDSDTVRWWGKRSNEGDIFYAASPGSSGVPRAEYFGKLMPSVMVHELKHLIAVGRRLASSTSSEEPWIEEASAMAAQQLAGLGTEVQLVQPYASNCLATPHAFRVVYPEQPSQYGERICTYGYNFLFVWRVAQLMGHDNFWRNWMEGPSTGIANIEAHTGMPFAELMMDWAAALRLDHANAIAGYDYDTFNLRDGTWQVLGTGSLESGVSGTARSMAYFTGRGLGGDARITLRVTNGAPPHAVVLRFPAVLP